MIDQTVSLVVYVSAVQFATAIVATVLNLREAADCEKNPAVNHEVGDRNLAGMLLIFAAFRSILLTVVALALTLKSSQAVAILAVICVNLSTELCQLVLATAAMVSKNTSRFYVGLLWVALMSSVCSLVSGLVLFKIMATAAM